MTKKFQETHEATLNALSLDELEDLAARLGDKK